MLLKRRDDVHSRDESAHHSEAWRVGTSNRVVRPPCWESIPGLHKKITNTGSGYIVWRNRFLSSLNVYKFGLKLVFLSLDGRAAGVEVTEDESRNEPKQLISNGAYSCFSVEMAVYVPGNWIALRRFYL